MHLDHKGLLGKEPAPPGPARSGTSWFTPAWAGLVVLMLLAGCSSPGLLPDGEPSPTPPGPDQPQACLKEFQQAPLPGAEVADQAGGAARTTLSEAEWAGYLAAMGLRSACLPPSLGSPFLAVDWDSAQGTADQGRMLSLGFSELYQGGRWGSGYLVYASYDFSAGTEYESFGSEADFKALGTGQAPGSFDANGTPGLSRVVRSQFCFGQCAAYQVYLFPFRDHYLAAVLVLGYYDFDADWEALLAADGLGSSGGELPEAVYKLASSLEFSS